LQSFLSSPRTENHHTIQIEDSECELDLLVIDRSSDLTIVFFHGAVPLSIETYPIFNGIGVSKLANANLIAVSDPSIQLQGISLGWHLGNQFTGPAADLIAVAVSHICESLNSKRTVFTGSSAGGYAAWNCGGKVENSVTLIANPHLAFDRPPYLKMPQLAKIGFGKEIPNKPDFNDLSFLQEFGPIDSVKHFPIKTGQTVLIYQNLGDRKFLTGQLCPFLMEAIHQPNIYYRFEFDGPGHLPIDRSNYVSCLKALNSAEPVGEVAAKIGFQQAKVALIEILREHSLVTFNQVTAESPETSAERAFREIQVLEKRTN